MECNQFFQFRSTALPLHFICYYLIQSIFNYSFIYYFFYISNFYFFSTYCFIFLSFLIFFFYRFVQWFFCYIQIIENSAVTMLNKKANSIKQRKQENKRLQLEAKKMEQQLERVRKLKAMQLEKDRLKLQMKQLQEMGKALQQPKKQDDQALRGYGQKLKKQTEIKARKKLQNKKLVQSSSSSQQQDKDSENLKYFLTVLGLSQYFELLVKNNILSMTKLRQIDQPKAKQLGIPLKDMIKINKKLRSMGY